MQNLLFTSAGRRNYLVRYFRDALARRGGGRVYGADRDPSAPALADCDVACRVPDARDAGYVDALLELCARERIDLVVPLNDFELGTLAGAHERFGDVGTRLAVSSPDIVERCFDKWATHRWLLAHGFASPPTWLGRAGLDEALGSGEATFPLVVKPRRGSASVGVHVVHDAEELALALGLLARQMARHPSMRGGDAPEEGAVLVQAMLPGPEYGIDVLNDFEARTRAVCTKEKLAMRSGETDKSRAVAHPLLESEARRLGGALGHVGNLDCDAFVVDGIVHVLEMNPRFGGGYPFSQEAGARWPDAMLAWLAGDEASPLPNPLDVERTFAKAELLVAVDGG